MSLIGISRGICDLELVGLEDIDKTDLGTDSSAEDSNTEEAEGVAVDADIAVKGPEERKQDLEERKLRLQEQEEKTATRSRQKHLRSDEDGLKVLLRRYVRFLLLFDAEGRILFIRNILLVGEICR